MFLSIRTNVVNMNELFHGLTNPKLLSEWEVGTFFIQNCSLGRPANANDKQTARLFPQKPALCLVWQGSAENVRCSGVVLAIIQSLTYRLSLTTADKTHQRDDSRARQSRASEIYCPSASQSAQLFAAPGRWWASSSENKYLGEMPNPLSDTHRALCETAGRNNASIARCNPPCWRGVTGKGPVASHTHTNTHKRAHGHTHTHT